MAEQRRLAVDGPFSLAAAAAFGFGPNTGRPYPADAVMRLACVADDLRHQVGVLISQEPGGDLIAEFSGAASLTAAEQQVRRILSVDRPAGGWIAAGRRDQVLGGLQAAHPGLRPVLFHSPYEAAAWAMLSQRRHRSQATALRRRISAQIGQQFELGGQTEHAFPVPDRLLGLTGFPGLEPRRLERLHGVARAALQGKLEPGRLAAMGTEEAMAEIAGYARPGPGLRRPGAAPLDRRDRRTHRGRAAPATLPLALLRAGGRPGCRGDPAPCGALAAVPDLGHRARARRRRPGCAPLAVAVRLAMAAGARWAAAPPAPVARISGAEDGSRAGTGAVNYYTAPWPGRYPGWLWRRIVAIGETLAEARRDAGLSLAEVSQRTRIRQTIIRAIEDDDYGACGGDFYARGHIRSIAKAVGADSEPLIQEYDQHYRAQGAAATVSLDELLAASAAGQRPHGPDLSAVWGMGAAAVAAARRTASSPALPRTATQARDRARRRQSPARPARAGWAWQELAQRLVRQSQVREPVPGDRPAAGYGPSGHDHRGRGHSRPYRRCALPAPGRRRTHAGGHAGRRADGGRRRRGPAAAAQPGAGPLCHRVVHPAAARPVRHFPGRRLPHPPAGAGLAAVPARLVTWPARAACQRPAVVARRTAGAGR